MAESRDPREFYIVDTRTTSTDSYKGYKNPGRFWSFMDLEGNEEFKAMKDLSRSGKLREAMSESGVPVQLRGNPNMFHDMGHMTEDVVKYKTEEGLVWVPKDKKEDAKKVMKALRQLDKEVTWFQMGLSMSDEELNTVAKVTPAHKPKS